MGIRLFWLGNLLVMLAGAGLISACSKTPAPIATPPNGDALFERLAHDVLDDYYRRNPTTATDLGIHDYDDRLEDYSAAAVAVEVRTFRGFKSQVQAIDPTTLSLDNQLDRDLLLHALDGILLQDEVIKPWETDPDQDSSGITNSAYVMAKREFAPAEDRLRKLVSRMKVMPGALAEAKRNLKNPPKIYTEIAIEQLDGNIDFFKSAIPDAFKDVGDTALRQSFTTANTAVVSALTEYKAWLQHDLLPHSNGNFAYGADTYRKRLWDEEMIDTPLEDLLTMAQADLAKNQAAFAQVAHNVDPKVTPMALLSRMQHDHPPEAQLLATTQAQLDALATFITDHHIVTIPQAERATVKETPPFMRATTSASMDIPGPFEKTASTAYYNMTLPDPKWPAKQREEFMEQWYYPAISNVSVHEVWPGHYLQFLYAKTLKSDVRKVFTANSNTEGWAHYSEQMMMDEGLHADDQRYKLAQLQDALLRDVRLIVGIRMHTADMTVAEAKAMFQKDAYQPEPVAESEAKRGTSDATYGYYTLGKLMIMKLRDDYKAKMGPAYTLEGFHNAFIKTGGLPIPLVRRAMLGESGNSF